MNSKGNEGRRLETRIEVDFDFHLPSLRHGWWALAERKGSARRKAQRGERRKEKQKEGGREDRRQEESETEIEKEDDAPSPLSVRGGKLSNREL